MKHDKWLSFLWSVTMGVLLSAAGIGCLVSAFEMPVSMWPVVLCCLGCSAAVSWAAGLKKSWLAACVPVLAVAAMAAFGGLLRSAEELIFCLKGQAAAENDPTTALCAFGIIAAFCVSWCIGGRKPVYASFVCALPLLLCMPVKTAAPDGVWLFAFLTGLALLILTQGLRRKLPEQGKRLVAMALIPAICLSAVLYFALPRDGYSMDKLTTELFLNVKSWLTGGPEEADEAGPLKVGGGAVGLSQIGDRKESGRKVMEVTWEQGGAMYLRSCAYDTYYNNTWTNLAVPNSLNWPDTSVLEPAGTVKIQTRGYLDMLLTPYYPMDGELEDVTRGLSNYVGKQEYSYRVGRLRTDYEALQIAPSSELIAFTQLPAQTSIWAKNVLRDVLSQTQSVSQKAEAIKNYVSQCAQYTLKPGKMPQTDTDFVRWFVEDNGKGYCVHFASAATVFLRAAGIPARYVTGYLFTAKAGETTEVYGKNAHAWTEYWLPGVGWVVLEATPPAAVEAQLAVEEEVIPQEEPETEKKETSFRLILPGAWFWWTLIAVTVVTTVAQWRLRVAIRRKKCRRGGINERAVAWWEELDRLCACLGCKPHEAVLTLAQKAQFSQHLLTDAELEAIRSAALETRKALEDLPLYKRLYHRLILALY